MNLKPVLNFLLPLFAILMLSSKGDDIPWSASRKLAWPDFKSRPDNNSLNAALTSSKIVFNYGYGDDKGFSYTISCIFDKSSSWGKVKTDYILSHEQGHFDIAEIYARKLNKALKNYRFNVKTSPKEIPAIYQQLMKEEGDFQNRYDTETNYSREKIQQAAWLQKIQQQLDDLKDFAGYVGG